jgi:hypothetical protein
LWVTTGIEKKRQLQSRSVVESRNGDSAHSTN